MHFGAKTVLFCVFFFSFLNCSLRIDRQRNHSITLREGKVGPPLPQCGLGLLPLAQRGFTPEEQDLGTARTWLPIVWAHAQGYGREGGGGGPGLTTWLKFVPGLDKASATLIKEELYNRCVWVVSRAEDPTRPGQCLTRVSPRGLTDKEREGLTTVRLVAIKREDSGQCRSELSEHKARTEKHAIFVQKNAATDQLICFYMLVQE